MRTNPFGDVISGGALCPHRFRAHPVLTRGTNAWSFMIAELRSELPTGEQNQQLKRRDKWAINVVMGINTFIKLKYKKKRRLENKE